MGHVFIFLYCVAGLVAHPWMDRPTGNTPAIPDGTLHLTTNLLNLHIDINCLLLWKIFNLTLFQSFRKLPLFLHTMFGG